MKLSNVCIYTIYTSYTMYNKRGDNVKKVERRIKLKQFRIGLQLTQQEIADKLNITATSYGAIENGKRDGCSQFWDNLQKAFNIPDSHMYGLMRKGVEES